MKIIILGNGISGVTVARHLRKKSNHPITIISSESKYFYSRTALMYIFMGHMPFENTQPYENHFWKKNKIDLIQTKVLSVDFKNKKLVCDNHPDIDYDKLVLATGSASNKFGWKGQDLEGVSGLFNLNDLKNIEKRVKEGVKKAVIVGGGLIGIELAEMLLSRNISVTMLVREKSFWDMVLPEEESQMINNHILEHHIDLRLENEITEITAGNDGKVNGVILKNGDFIDCEFVGLTVGVHANIDFLKGGDLEINRGILVDDFLQTNIDDVYAIGDCAEVRKPKAGRRPTEAVWYVGKMMGETVANTILGTPVKYDPVLWYNSAKFLDIEYQVYGTVLAHPPENHKSLFWQSKDGKKSIRIVFNKENMEVLGFNLFGIRFRHRVCEKWILDKTKIREVLENLKLAEFDPEFFPQYSENFIQAYNNSNSPKIKLKAKRSLAQVLSFLNK